jgi:hypothetical protein
MRTKIRRWGRGLRVGASWVLRGMLEDTFFKDDAKKDLFLVVLSWEVQGGTRRCLYT